MDQRIPVAWLIEKDGKLVRQVSLYDGWKIIPVMYADHEPEQPDLFPPPRLTA